MTTMTQKQTEAVAAVARNIGYWHSDEPTDDRIHVSTADGDHVTCQVNDGEKFTVDPCGYVTDEDGDLIWKINRRGIAVSV